VRYREEGLLESVGYAHRPSTAAAQAAQAVQGGHAAGPAGVGPAPRAAWRKVWQHAQGELFAVGPFFAASALLASVVQGLAPLHAITAFTHDSFWSIPLLMLLGALLSLCSSADAFVAVGLSTLFSPGAILGFLLAGQMVDLRNLALMPQVFSRRALIVGLPVVVVAIGALAVVTNTLLGSWFI